MGARDLDGNVKGSGLNERRLVAESVGTALLVIIGAGSVMTDALSGHALGAVGIALSFMLVVLGVIVGIGHISGAHINPAVTIALWSMRRFPTREVVPYVIAQCIGAVGGALFLRLALGDVVAVGATIPHVSTAPAFAVEFTFSFVLMFVIAAVATDRRVPGGIGPLAIGGTVGFCALQGWLTGASMNPARSFGPAIVSGVWTSHWLYWLAPISGMLAAAHLYEWLRGANTTVVPHGVAVGSEGPIQQ
ncbi:MAG: aquaporin [Gemmatimonadota bacterium]|nr:aquaporin [Gemmatimonadota bacterium]